ncbi:ATP-binding cassette domain-containing protein [Paractinoplanes rishiriensis]|uniref:ATP-binding cassette domain-containing protein n=1 Tax=Paractinoplanes rishiriensis TaxID=1050105 RepID=UPI001940E837|nr:ATP-binding cassette domain-containing protein [Actinoplanes rishiriensis]
MRFDQVWFRYARRAGWTLRAVDAVAEPGHTVMVLGHNGAGKSTLLQLAAGVLRPQRGVIHDRPAVIGWVPERFPADQPFTTRQYLHRMAEVRGLRDPAAADAWIERLLLTEFTGTRLADLSKGTAQKVGLAQALLIPPGLLVLDEPWEGLDSVARTLIPQIVDEVTTAGGTVLVSDHRGEITSLPGAAHWTVSESTVHASAAEGGPDQDGPDEAEVIVEVAVRRREADQAVVRLRAAGHRVLGVRDQDVHGGSGAP